MIRVENTLEQNVDISIKGVDLFCGAGGLTKGLENAGINVCIGVDIDPACEYPFSANNNADYLMKSVEDVSGTDFAEKLSGADFTLLAGCAPCQPFSTYRQGKSDSSDKRWNLLQHFARLVKETNPDFVTMENVPRLAQQSIFDNFVSSLKSDGYAVCYNVVNCADYGVPQQRRRLVLLASKLGPIKMIEPTVPNGRPITVQEAIGDLPPISAGDVSDHDTLHQACGLSSKNMERIKVSRPGGSWREWDKHLIADCHKKSSGKTYPSVYGRMCWDKPSPTMTTQFYGFGNGRFGHPEQDRAISIREGAILQSFPNDYEFVAEGKPVYRKTLGRLIGNAVPVKLGEAIGLSIVQHVRHYINSQKGETMQ